VTTKLERRERWVRNALDTILAERYEHDWIYAISIVAKDETGAVMCYSMERGSGDIMRMVVTDTEDVASAVDRSTVDVTSPPDISSLH